MKNKINKSLELKEKKYILQTYKRYPICISRGRGKYLYDTSGKKYLDFFSGIAVNSMGHHDSGILRVIREQSDKYLHTSNYFFMEPQVLLAEKLIKNSFPGKVFF